MNLLEEYCEDAAEELTKEIDFQVLGTMLSQSGWTQVVRSTDRSESTVERSEVAKWVTENCSGKSMGLRSTWYFERKEDAVLFTLRWV